MTKIILFLFYPVLLFARVLNLLLGRDPLRLRERDSGSFWVQRGPEPSRSSYFSEASQQEEGKRGGFGRLAMTPLAWVARWFAPPRSPASKDFRPGAEREQGIPDEVYTLW